MHKQNKRHTPADKARRIVVIPKHPCKRCGGTSYWLDMTYEYRYESGRSVSGWAHHFWCVGCTTETHLVGHTKFWIDREDNDMADRPKDDDQDQDQEPKPVVDPTRKDLSIDYNTGKVFIPGVGDVDLVNVDVKRLKEAHEQWERDKALMNYLRASTFVCTQCKKEQRGGSVRVKLHNFHGTRMTIFVCVDRKCDGPVLMKTPAPKDSPLVRTDDKGSGIII